MKSVVCFGDSLTQMGFQTGGWLSLLAADFEAKADVLNRGFSGYNTEMALSYAYDFSFPSLDADSVLAIVFCFGANDAAFYGKQGVHVDKFRANVATLLKRLRVQFPRAKIILCSPPPVHDGKYEKHCRETYDEPQSRSLEATRKYRDAVASIESELFDHFVDMYAAFDEAKDGALFSDGLHLSPSGNRVFYKAVAAAMKPQDFERSFAEWRSLLPK